MSNKSKIIELVNSLEKDVTLFKVETLEKEKHTSTWDKKTIKHHTIIIKIKDE